MQLPDREPGVVGADVVLELDPGERLEIVHSCTDVYMTFLGRAVFTPEFAARRLGIEKATSLAYNAKDNPVLRTVVSEFPRVELRALSQP